MNLLVLLEKMRLNGEFHADLKIANIGYDDSLNIILIDYDENTIMSISDGERKFAIRSDIPYYMTLITSYTNAYLQNLDHTHIDAISKYNKYSMYGLWMCIFELGIKLRNGLYLSQTPNFERKRFNNPNYGLIPDYIDLINSLRLIEIDIVP
jgi:hypothetical protein